MGCANSIQQSHDDCQDTNNVVVSDEKKDVVVPTPIKDTPIIAFTPSQIIESLLLRYHKLAIDAEATMGTPQNGVLFNEFLNCMADDSEGFIKYLGTDPSEIWSKTEFITAINARGTDQFGWNYWPVANTFNLKSLDNFTTSGQYWATLIGQKTTTEGKFYSFYMRCSGQVNLVGDTWKIVSYNLTMCLPNRFFYDVMTLCGYTGGDFPVVTKPVDNTASPSETDCENILDQATYYAWKGVVDTGNQSANSEDWAAYISCFGPPGPMVDPLEPACVFDQWIGTDATETWNYPEFVDAVQPTYIAGDSREYFGWSYVPDAAGWNVSSVDGYQTQGSYWATLSGFKSVVTDGVTTNYTFPVRMSGYNGFVPNIFLPPLPRWMICERDLAVLIPNDKFYDVLDLIYPNAACMAPLPNMPITQDQINSTTYDCCLGETGSVDVVLEATTLGTNGATPFHAAIGQVSVGTPGQDMRTLMDTGCSLCWMGSLNNQTEKNPQQAFFLTPDRNLYDNGASSTWSYYQVDQNDTTAESKSASAVKKFSRYTVGGPRRPNMPLHYGNSSTTIKKQLANYTATAGEEAKVGAVPIMDVVTPDDNEESFGPWGSIESILNNDVVNLPNGSTLPYIFCEAITVPAPATLLTTEFEELQNDGFLGMAFRNTDPRFPEEHITFLERVENNSSTKMVSFDFQTKVCRIGGYDTTVAKTDWKVLPVRHTMLGGQYWDVLTSGVLVDNVNCVAQFGTLGAVYQIFDTGASYIKLNPTETNVLLKLQFGDAFDTAVDQTTLWNNPDNADDFLGLSVIVDKTQGKTIQFSFVPCYPLDAAAVVVTLPVSIPAVYTSSTGVQTTYDVSPLQALVGLPNGNWVFGNVANQYLKMTFDDSQALPCIWVADNGSPN